MLSETSKLQFIIEDETRNYEIFDVMNINLNNLDVFLEFTAFISDLINRGLDKMGEITKKLYDTLTGIQLGRIEAPEGWIKVIS